MVVGLLLILIAALLQGTFLMPMAFTRKWEWEHNWAMFSLLAMLFLNWVIALAILPNPLAIYGAVPSRDLLMLVLFGTAWGGGAVLFGLGMDKLGLTLGYPLIMGLNAAVGALVPMIWFHQEDLLSARSVTMAGGIALAISGIVLCSLAGARKEPSGGETGPKSAFVSGLLIAIAAGCLASLPNIGMTYGKSAIAAARSLGASPTLAGNAVWVVFFSLGGIVNIGYCALRMAQKGNVGALACPETPRNLGLGFVMALMWMSSLYFYGMGAGRMGTLGAVIGWPVLLSVSIGAGILWGLWKGEWRGAPPASTRLLRGGLLLLLAAVATLGLANTL